MRVQSIGEVLAAGPEGPPVVRVIANDVRSMAELSAARGEKIEALRALHRPDPNDTIWCHADGFGWPCETARILNDYESHPGRGGSDG